MTLHASPAMRRLLRAEAATTRTLYGIDFYARWLDELPPLYRTWVQEDEMEEAGDDGNG
jgi:hypothetical protein